MFGADEVGEEGYDGTAVDFEGSSKRTVGDERRGEGRVASSLRLAWSRSRDVVSI